MPQLTAILCARRRVAAALLVIAAAAFAPAVLRAQINVILLVQGEPITEIDVEQRARFLQLANNRPSPRLDVIQELIDEKIKLRLTVRFDFTGLNLDGDVENAFANMARKRNMNMKQFYDELTKLGVLSTLKSRVRAEIIWTQIVRGKYQSTLQLNDSEILKELEIRKSEEKEGFDYTLRPILFIVPRGASQAAIETRRREAEGLRQRFLNCAEGLPFARALRDVAVQNPVVSSSANLAPALREILEKTEVGRLTPPEVTPEGIVVYALCSKTASAKDNSPGKSQLRQEIYSKQFQAVSQKFLKELRDQAYCATTDGRVIKGCLATELGSR
jgi:peptidyl-prolyl cis-trans isomerase SurA